jgi:hypothetical protein
MAKFCECGSGLGPNGGAPSCGTISTESARFLVVPTYDKDGNLNTIPSGTTLDSAYINSKLYADEDRWVILERHDNASSDRGEPISQTFQSGSIEKVDQGARTVNVFYKKVQPTYGQELGKLECGQWSFFPISTEGDIQGIVAEDHSYIRPIIIEKGTVTATWVEPNRGTPQVPGYNFTFQWGINERDEEVMKIDSSDIEIDLLTAPGIIGVSLALTNGVAAAVDSVSIDAFFKLYGGFDAKTPYEAGEVSDFVIFNNTTSSVVPVLTATQDPSGTYELTYAAQTLADELVISLAKPSVSNKPFQGLNTVITTIV